MRRVALVLSVALLAACAATPNPWESLDVPREPTTRPADLPRFPLPSEVSDSGVTYDETGTRLLDGYKTACEAADAIAREVAAKADAYQDALAACRDAGLAQRAVAELRAEMVREYRRRLWFERAGFVIVIVGLAL